MSHKHNPHCFMGVDIRGKVRLQYRHFSDVVKHFHRQFSAARKLSEILKRNAMSKCRETIFRYELIDERDSVVGTLYSKEKRSIPFGEPGENFDLAYSVKETKFLELEKATP